MTLKRLLYTLTYPADNISRVAVSALVQCRTDFASFAAIVSPCGDKTVSLRLA